MPNFAARRLPGEQVLSQAHMLPKQVRYRAWTVHFSRSRFPKLLESIEMQRAKWNARKDYGPCKVLNLGSYNGV